MLGIAAVTSSPERNSPHPHPLQVSAPGEVTVIDSGPTRLTSARRSDIALRNAGRCGFNHWGLFPLRSSTSQFPSSHL